MSKKQRNKQRGQLANSVGQLGEEIFQRLCPTAIKAQDKQCGCDFLTLDGKLLELKTSRFNPKTQGWRFELSYQQCLCADWVCFLLLNQFGSVFKEFLIPLDEIPARKNELNEFNLRDYSQWEVKA
jgi:hypothetical protein